MRFFDYNYAFKTFGGTFSASSNITAATYAFDELVYTRWSSVGENSDATASYVERNFGAIRTFTSIFLREHNFKTPIAKYWDGAAWQLITGVVIQNSTDLAHSYLKFPSISTLAIRIYNSPTLVANAEKMVNEIMVFDEIGALVIPSADIDPKRVKTQINHELDNAKYMKLNRGTRWEITLKFKAHIGLNDINLLRTLATRDAEFYLWINDNSEGDMSYLFEPFMFKDIYKLSIDKGDNPGYYKNMWFSGMDNQFKLVEVV